MATAQTPERHERCVFCGKRLRGRTGRGTMGAATSCPTCPRPETIAAECQAIRDAGGGMWQGPEPEGCRPESEFPKIRKFAFDPIDE